MPNEAIGEHWFEPLAEHMGSAYLRYSFTKGTVNEIDFIVRQLDLQPGARILDVGCGPGRHSHELARRGFTVHGIDISQPFIDLATANAVSGSSFERMDARAMTFDNEFDVVICLCQGAFGLMTAGGHDIDVLTGIRRALKPQGALALSAFNAYFAVKYFEEAQFDANTGVNHEKTEVRNQGGEVLGADLWTGCYTPRELRLMLEKAQMNVRDIFSVDPGDYGDAVPSLETSEYLVIAFPSPSQPEGAC
jgi:2-polyprenyl-3-methyl-5-hydroxy-6-metoxy-1,4-benzoquinol methylase